MNIYRPSSYKRRLRHKHGFTIIEVVVVMGILVLMIGASFAFLSGLGPEKSMREVCVELESMAREAQARAIMTHTPQRIIITDKSFLMMEKDAKPLAAEEWVTLPTRKTYELESYEEIQISIYRWGATYPVYPSEVVPMVWLFPPDGFVEPITIVYTHGDSYIKQTYHPLTASVVDEEMEIK